MRLSERDSKTNNKGLTREAGVRNEVSEAHCEEFLFMEKTWLEEKREKGENRINRRVERSCLGDSLGE